MERNVNDVVNPALMLAISRMREHDTEKTRSKMLLEALNARFLVPFSMKIKPGTETEKKRTGENTAVNFDMLKTNKGELYFVAFSDVGEMSKWRAEEERKGTPLMLMSFDGLARLVRQSREKANGFILNPNTTNLCFRREVIETTLKNRDRAIAEGKMTVQKREDETDGAAEQE